MGLLVQGWSSAGGVGGGEALYWEFSGIALRSWGLLLEGI